jgi:hypothetical protein
VSKAFMCYSDIERLFPHTLSLQWKMCLLWSKNWILKHLDERHAVKSSHSVLCSIPFRDDSNRSTIYLCRDAKTKCGNWWRRLLRKVKKSNNICCRLLFISSLYLYLLKDMLLWPKIRHSAELGVITRVSSMCCG